MFVIKHVNAFTQISRENEVYDVEQGSYESRLVFRASGRTLGLGFVSVKLFGDVVVVRMYRKTIRHAIQKEGEIYVNICIYVYGKY